MASSSSRDEEAQLDLQLRLFASYSPAEVVLRYAGDPEPKPPAEPEHNEFPGAIGFVDVSGFTALSERLNKDFGRKGAELLNQYINAYFKELIDGIFRHAGDVIKFAGDAMQVVWRNRRDTCESLPQLVLRASACCLDLLKRLNNFSPVEGVTLKLHMGVGCGTISEFYVGGHGNKWEYFVAGQPIEQMSDATEEATHGQLVLSQEAYDTINSEEITSYKRLVGEVLESKQYLLKDILEGADAPAKEREAPQAGGMLRSLGLARQHTLGLNLPGHSSQDLTEKSMMAADKPERSTTSKGRRASTRPLSRSATKGLLDPLKSCTCSAASSAASSSSSSADEPASREKSAGSPARGGQRRSILKGDRSAPDLSDLAQLQDATAEGSTPGGHRAGVTIVADVKSEVSAGSPLGEQSVSKPRRGRGSILHSSLFASKTAQAVQAEDDDKEDASRRLDITSLLGELKPTVELDRTLRCFVPAIIEERVQAGQTGSWVSEHRKLVSVFMKINGLGPKPCEVTDLAKASEVCGIVQANMQKWDGTITRLICDDKGTRFLIAFGLPGHAQEDDEARAVISCLNVVDALSRIKPVLPEGVSADDEDYQAMKICVGITTGRVFCGEAGAEGVRVEYTLSGARVNLAARLMQAAGKTKEKGILIDKDTYDAALASPTAAQASFETLDPIKVKGKEESVPIFRPLLKSDERKTRMPGFRDELSRTSGRGSDGSTSDLHGSMRHSNSRSSSGSTSSTAKPLKRTLGRETEQLLLRQGLDGLGAGKGGAILLLGEAGMGKTHLVELLRSMHERKMAEERLKATDKAEGAPSTEGVEGAEGVPPVSAAPTVDMMVEGSQLGLFLISLKSIEATTPFFPWKGVFEKLFTARTLQKLAAKTRKVKPPPPSVPDEDKVPTQGRRNRRGSGDFTAALGGAARKKTNRDDPNFTQDLDSRPTDIDLGDVTAMALRAAADSPAASASSAVPRNVSFADPSEGTGPATPRADGGAGPSSPPIGPPAGRESLSKDGKPTPKKGRRQSRARWKSSKGGRSDTLRQRWRDVYSSVLAYMLPAYMIEGRHCVRPSADDLLLLDENFVQLAPLLSPVLPINIKDNEVTKHLTGDTRKTATIRLMVTVLEAKLGAGRPVVVFEDVHWMDSSSWAVLQHALDVVKPMLVLLTLRPLPEPARPAGYDEIVKLHKLTENAVCELPGLSVNELRDLVCETMGVSDIQSEIMPLLAEKTNGNPFWALEFLKSMTDSKLIEVVDGCCKLTVSIDKVTLPSSVESLITSRMDRMAPQQQLLMKMGSVIGTNFKTTELGFLGEQLRLDMPTDTELIQVLDKLCHEEMLQREPGQRATPEYKFRHKYLQDVSYSLMPEELKEKLHRAAAEFYEGSFGLHSTTLKGIKGHSHVKAAGSGASKLLGEVHGGGGQDLVWKLSYHWKNAGETSHSLGKAVRYLTLAGDAAFGTNSLVEARQLLLEALQLAQKEPELASKRGPLQRRMAKCHLEVGEKEKARESLLLAVVSLGGEKDKDGHGDAFAGLSERDFEWRYRKLLMRHWLYSIFSSEPKRKANQLGASSGVGEELREDTLLELAIAYELLARVAMQENMREQAGYCAMRALRLSHQLPTLTPVVGRAYALIMLVEAASDKSSAKTVARYKRKSLETCEQVGELGLLSYSLLKAGELDAGQARWFQATDNLARSMSISEQLRANRDYEEAMCHQAHLDYYHGNFIESKELYQKALASAESRGDKQIRNRCNAGIAASLLVIHDLAGAIAILKSTNSFGQLALALLRSGQREEAFEKAMRVKDRFKGKRTKYYVLKAFASTAEVILKLLEEAYNQRHAHESAESQQKAAAKSRNTLGGGKVSGSSPPKARDSQGDGDGDEDDKPRFDDLATLEQLGQEWIERLYQFGSIYPVAKPRALLLKGIFYMVQTSPAAKKKAASLFRQSQACAHTLQMPYDEALAVYELYKHPEFGHERDRIAKLQTALDAFQACGAEYDRRRCKQQIDSAKADLTSKRVGGPGAQQPVARGEMMSVVGDANVSTYRSSSGGEDDEGDDEIDDEATVFPGQRYSAELKAANLRAALSEHGTQSALSGFGAAPATAADAKVSPKVDEPGSFKLPVSAATRKRGQGAGTEGCSMGCGSEPNEAPTKTTASARVQSTCARPAPEETSASERTRAANGSAGTRPSRESSFLDKAKVKSASPPEPKPVTAPEEIDTFC